jgi:hypothetical protein
MKITILTTFLLVALASVSCKKEGPEGKKSLIDFINEPIGSNCNSGGFKVLAGIDLNDNNILDEKEVQNTKYICNGNTGPDGLNSLINTIDEPAGVNCSSGGYKILSGIDMNGNNILDESEVQNTDYLCNGDDGATGKNSLVNVLDEPAGVNCSSGGYKVQSGTDLNENNILDDNEVQNTDYLCNGDDGAAGINSLVNVLNEPAGVNCTAGGYMVLSGNDLNRNNILDDNEVQNTEYLCNGLDGGYDKEIIIDLFGNFVYDNTNYIYPMEFLRIKDFDIRNYLNADSIAFQTYLEVRYATGTVTVELYDFTNSKPIANTVLIGSSTNKTWGTTKTNFINDLPKMPITLGIRGKISSTSAAFGMTTNPRLVIYRK